MKRLSIRLALSAYSFNSNSLAFSIIRLLWRISAIKPKKIRKRFKYFRENLFSDSQKAPGRVLFEAERDAERGRPKLYFYARDQKNAVGRLYFVVIEKLRDVPAAF